MQSTTARRSLAAARLVRLLPVFILAALTAVPASSPAQTDKNRLVFQPGSDAPLPTPGPTPTPVPAAAPKDQLPEEAVELFFLALQSGKVSEAYDAIVRGTIIADRPDDVAALKARTIEALDNYGPARGYEIVSRLEVGKHLLRLTCISLNSDLPLRWRFYFYRPAGSWKLVDLRIDDALVELFEEEARRSRQN